MLEAKEVLSFLNPFSAVVKINKRLRSTLESRVNQLHPFLSQHEKDLQRRHTMQHLEELQNHCKCCVCHVSGEKHTSDTEMEGGERELPGAPLDEGRRKKKKDKGLTLIQESELETITKIFHKPVQGYLCTVLPTHCGLDTAEETGVSH